MHAEPIPELQVLPYPIPKPPNNAWDYRLVRESLPAYEYAVHDRKIM